MRINPVILNKKILSNTQFSFINKHFSLHQIHRAVDIIASSLEQKHLCTGAFLDVTHAFDRVWHDGLLYKLRFLPTLLHFPLKSFLTHCSFKVHCDDEFSAVHHIKAGVSQGSILAPTHFYS